MWAKRLIPVAIFIIVAVLCGLAAHYSVKNRPQSDPAAAMVNRRAKISFAKLSRVPMHRIDQCDLTSASQSLVNKLPTADQPDAIAALTQADAYLRHYASDTNTFFSWLRSQGYAPGSAAHVRDFASLANAYTYCTGTQPAPGWETDVWSQVAAIRTYFATQDFAKIQSISADPAGIDVHITTWQPPSLPPSPPTSNVQSAVPVAARAGSTWASIIGCEPSLTRFRAGKSSRIATIAFVARFADGTLRPLSIQLIHDQPSNRWFVESMSHGTFDAEDPRIFRFGI